MRIAVLEDDQGTQAMYLTVLAKSGHEVVTYMAAEEMIKAMFQQSFDLFIIDWILPGKKTGLDALQAIRSHVASKRTPVIFATSRDDEADIIAALEMGADDYLIKPLRPGELAARVAAMLRRAYPQADGGSFETGIYRFDLLQEKVFVNQTDAELASKEFALALFLFRHVGALVTRNHISHSVWGREMPDTTRSIDTYASRLRSKLDIKPENGFRLLSERSIGYRLLRVESLT